MGECPYCGKGVDFTEVCPHCGADLSGFDDQCPFCGVLISRAALICPRCGSDVYEFWYGD